MKKSSETLGLKVMGIREGLENGIAQDFMIDAAKRTVEYLILKDNNGYGFRAIATGDVLGIGADYIMTSTIENAKKIYESKEILEVIEKGFFILGATVLSSTGDVIGGIVDFSFDEKTGALDTLYLDNGEEYSGNKITTLAGKMVFVDKSGNEALRQTVEAVAAAPAVEEAPKPSALEEESKAYLLGKVVKNDVESSDGAFRLSAGTVLTEEILEQVAKYNDVLLTLTMDV